MPLVFATGNRHKFGEIAAVLAGYGLGLQQHKTELQEISSNSPREIAMHKAQSAFAELRTPLIVEDTAVYFTAFKDFPGTMPKRIYESIGFRGMLKLLEGKSRNAFFLCTICFIESENTQRFFEGKLEGKIAKRVIKPKADRMPYEKIFIPKGSKKAIVEMPLEEKNAISHRAIAAKKLAEWLKERSLHELIETI